MEVFRDTGNGLECLVDPPADVVPIVEILLVILAFLKERIPETQWTMCVQSIDARRPNRKNVEISGVSEADKLGVKRPFSMTVPVWCTSLDSIIRLVWVNVINPTARTPLEQAAFMSLFMQTMQPTQILMHFDTAYDGIGSSDTDRPVSESLRGVAIISTKYRVTRTIDIGMLRDDLGCVETIFTETIKNLLREKLQREVV